MVSVTLLCSRTYTTPATLLLIHTFPSLHTLVYLDMTESCSTSHSLVVWTQETNWPYRGQTHKIVLDVWWRGMPKFVCVCVWMGVAVGGTSSYSSAFEEFPWAPLPGSTVWPEQARPAPVSPAWRHAFSHSWSQERPGLLLFAPWSKELDSVSCTKQGQEEKKVKKSWSKQEEKKIELKF